MVTIRSGGNMGFSAISNESPEETRRAASRGGDIDPEGVQTTDTSVQCLR